MRHLAMSTRWPRISSLALGILLLAACPVSALDGITPQQACAQAVMTAYNYLSFVGNYTGQDFCQNPLKVDSINAAFTVHCSPRDVQTSVHLLDTFCQHHALPASDWVYDPIKVSQLKVVEFGDFRRKFDRLSEPVMISEAFYDRSFRTLVCTSCSRRGFKTSELANLYLQNGWRNTFEAHRSYRYASSIYPFR